MWTYSWQFYRNLCLFKGGLLQYHFSLAACSHAISSVSADSVPSHSGRFSSPSNGLAARSNEGQGFPMPNRKQEQQIMKEWQDCSSPRLIQSWKHYACSMLLKITHYHLSPTSKSLPRYLIVTAKTSGCFAALHRELPVWSFTLRVLYRNWQNRYNLGIS